MNQQKRSANINPSSIGAAAALFVATCCGAVAIAIIRGQATSSSLASSAMIKTATAAAAAASRSMRGVEPAYRGSNRHQRQREHSPVTRTLPASIESPAGALEESAGDEGQNDNHCSDLKRRQCAQIAECEFMGGKCLPKATVGPDAVEGGDSDKPILDESNPCTQISSRKTCMRDKSCRYNRKMDYCHGRKFKNDGDGGEIDPKTDPQVISDPLEPSDGCPEGQCLNPKSGRCEEQVACFADPCAMNPCDAAEICSSNYCGGCHPVCSTAQADPKLTNTDGTIAVVAEPTTFGDPVPQMEAVCGLFNACLKAGDTCEVGTETCCGMTHNSMECTCGANDDGSLQYYCMYTEACMFPSCGTEPLSEPKITATLATESVGGNAMFKMYQGPCTDDSQCEGGLLCHASSGECICNALTNEGCDPGQVCGVPPDSYCPQPEGCLPMCTCDYNSDADDGSNGCPVGEVCRTPCAMADGGPMCFESNERRDCGDVWGSDYFCKDSNEDGVIDRDDRAAGCVEVRG